MIEGMRLVIDGHTLYDHFPGIGRYTFHLIEGIAALAPHDQIIVPLNPRLPNRRFDLTRLASLPNVSLIETRLTPFVVSYQFALARLVRAVQPIDLWHFPYYVRPYVGLDRSAVTIFDLTPIKFPTTLPTRAHAWLFRWAMHLAIRSSRFVLTTSEASRADLRNLFKSVRKPIVVTPLAAEARFRPASTAQIGELRARFHLPERFILSLSMNKPHKNLPRLMAAFAKVETDVPLVLAGFHDPRFADPKVQAEALGIIERVRFIGAPSDDDLPVLYSAATAVAVPSLYEGFGLPVLEAMACGTPVICSNSSSLAEVAGEAAVLVDPADIDGWTSVIWHVLDDPALRAQLRERGLNQAQKFSWARTAHQTYDAYRQQAELW